MIVMKFGGTSVEDAASVERVAEIIRERLPVRPVVVVSAMGKTTRKLLQAAEASAAGDARTTLAIVAELKTRHLSEARALVKRGVPARLLDARGFIIPDDRFGGASPLFDITNAKTRDSITPLLEAGH